MLARQPEDALESTVFVSPLDFLLVGKVKVNGAGVATWHATPGVSLTSDYTDLHLRCDDGIINAATLPSVTLDVTTGNGADTAVASFAVPGWRDDQNKTFPIGACFDFVPQAVGDSAEPILTIVGLDSTAGLPANSEWSVWASPAESTFVEIGFKRGASAPYQVPGQIEIPDKYEQAAAVKRGRSESPELSLEMVHVHSFSGLALYNGQNVTVLVKVVRDRTVHVGWDIYQGYRPEASPSRGDGNEEVAQSSSGPYQKHLLFTAL